MPKISNEFSLHGGTAGPRRWRRHVLITSIVLVVLTICIEATLRLTLGLGNPVLYQPDAACGYVFVPSQDVHRFGCHNYINAYSMRSPEISPTKPAGVFRIMCVGDSITYGTTYLDQDAIFTSLLAHTLPARLNRPVEVLNASAGEWAPTNELGYLKSRGTFESDSVIFILNSDDLVQPFNDQTPEPTHKPMCAISELVSRYIIRRWVAPYIHGTASAPSPPDVDRDTPKMLAALQQAKDIAQSHRASFMVVFSPKAGDELLRPGFQMLKQWCLTNNVPLIDMTTAYAKFPPDQIYIDGIHLKPLAHSLVAQAMADEIVARQSPR